MNRRRIPAFVLALAVLLAACGEPDPAEDTSRREVVAAFYPLVFIATTVAGDLADVVSVTPPGVQPHNLELTAAQRRRVGGADLLIYLGGGFQPEVERLVPEVASTLDVLAVRPAGERGADPHIWLDPVLMVAMTEAVATALARVDPRNGEAYRDNARELVTRIQDLDDDFQTGLSRCARREIVTGHEAFGYLADRFNLGQVGIAGIDPAQPPPAPRIEEVAQQVRESGVATIFYERLLPEGPAEEVAGAAGAVTALLDPLESAPRSGDYLTVMQQNLRALRSALECR